MPTSDPALPLKPLSTYRLYKDGSTQEYLFKTTKVTVSPNFIETERVKQNEKTQEFFSIDRTRETP